MTSTSDASSMAGEAVLSSRLFESRANLGRAAEFGLIGVVVALAIAAWILTGNRMHGMDAGPGTDLGGLGWFAGVWVVMTAAMMLPSILPMILTHSRIRTWTRERGAAAVPAATTPPTR